MDMLKEICVVILYLELEQDIINLWVYLILER